MHFLRFSMTLFHSGQLILYLWNISTFEFGKSETSIWIVNKKRKFSQFKIFAQYNLTQGLHSVSSICPSRDRFTGNIKSMMSSNNRDFCQ